MTDYEGSTLVENRYTRAHVPKTWGEEEVVVNTPQYCCKLLWLDPGNRSSLHYHEYKDETFLVLEGAVCVEIPPKLHVLVAHPGRESIRVMPHTPHRFWALGGEPALVVEASTHHTDTDVTRLEPSGPCLS